MKNTIWTILSFSLPTKSQAIRVKVWRRLQTIGAVQVKNSLYVLPANAAHMEHFTWLAKEVEEADGEVLLFETDKIRNMTDKAIMNTFTRERDADYAALDEELHAALALARDKELVTLDRELLSTRRKLARRFEAVQNRDFFPSGKGTRTATLLNELTSILDGRSSEEEPDIPLLRREDYIGKLWITRARPYVDRLASIWIVRRFLDPEARFAFVSSDAKTEKRDNTIRFDMAEAEFTHIGGRITFEVMIASFGLARNVPAGLVNVIRAIDLEEVETAPVEIAGIKRLLDGLLISATNDEELTAIALTFFDALSSSYH
ncbi:MAG: chromate resistance protein ChrB domain-containing protein [Solidesulfovibrio sp.]